MDGLCQVLDVPVQGAGGVRVCDLEIKNASIHLQTSAAPLPVAPWLPIFTLPEYILLLRSFSGTGVTTMAEATTGNGRGKTPCDIGAGKETPDERRVAFVTMVTSDDFVIGAEVMLHSLREHCGGSTRRPALVVMVTSGVSKLKRQALKAVSDEVIEVRLL